VLAIGLVAAALISWEQVNAHGDEVTWRNCDRTITDPTDHHGCAYHSADAIRDRGGSHSYPVDYGDPPSDTRPQDETTRTTRTTRTTTVVIDSRQSDEQQQQAADEVKENCKGGGQHECTYTEREVQVYGTQTYTDENGREVSERVVVETHIVTTMRMTGWDIVEQPVVQEQPRGEWSAEASGCSADMLTANPGVEVWCEDGPTVPRQRAQFASISRPRATYVTVSGFTDANGAKFQYSENAVSNVPVRWRVPVLPIVRGTGSDTCQVSSPSRTADIHTYSTEHNTGVSDEQYEPCQPVYRFEQSSFLDAQRFGTLRSITTPEVFDRGAYDRDGDGEFSQAEYERFSRAEAIHRARWEAYEKAVNEASKEGQPPFWICTHLSHFEVEDDGKTVYMSGTQCQLQVPPEKRDAG
jgi:hypothetical protein